MKLYQLAHDTETYGSQAGWWLVVSDNLEDEIAGPFETRGEAEVLINAEETHEDG